MNITDKQLLILFDIAKGILYHTDKQFAGYTKETIGKLLNEIIQQQDDKTFLELSIEEEINVLDDIIEDDTISQSGQDDDVVEDIIVEKNKNDFWD
ncbi:hypothetical protein M0Q50_08480 [bacterium]|jgi:hypothetical protein|nr:hypothetical protein [bacterium]